MLEKVIPIDKPDNDSVNNAQYFFNQIRDNQVTHGIICYRTKDGDLKYILFNPNHLTYIIGLMERVKIFLLND